MIQKKIEKELYQKETLVRQNWEDLYVDIEKRNVLLNDLCLFENKITILSPFCLILIENENEIKKYINNCTIDFVNSEYNLNQAFIFFREEYSKNNNIQNDHINSLISAIHNHDIQINNKIKNYNDVVLSFNEYYSTFPNFVIGKRKGFQRKILFSIKYGVDNERNIEKKEKLIENLKKMEETL